MHPSYININTNNNINNTSFCYYNNHEEPVFKSRNIPVALKTKCSLTGSGRSSKKDRHSKINTARGPRDRRMRLSLDVAKKFFNLQDMLGFDKASNTIEWLLMKSKAAIRDLHNQQLSLMGLSNSPSSASECEVMSGSIDDQITVKNEEDNKVIIKEKKKIERVVKKSVYTDHSLAKQSREKARARARKRTNEKRNIKIFGCYDGAANCHQFSVRPNLDHVMDQNMNRLGSIPFGENQVLLTDHSEYASSHFQFKLGNIGDSSSMMSTNWSPSLLFNYQHTNPVISHEPQFIDLQILGKTWEGINN